MADSPDQTPKPKSHPPLSSKRTDVVGTAVALITGAFASKLYMHEKVITNFRSLGAFEEIKKSGARQFSEIHQKALSGEITREESAGLIRKIALRKNKEAHGLLDQHGIKSMIEEWKSLYPYQRVETLAFGAAAASVALGVIFTIADRVSQRHRDAQPYER